MSDKHRSILWGAVALAAALLVCRANAAEPRPYNLLFLMTDQHHAGALACAGHPLVKSPNLDRLAAGGTRFANAFCPVPYCSPTRASIVTGLYPGSLGLGRNIKENQDDPLRLRDPQQTYLHQLAARGYHCHQLGKWHLGKLSELSCFSDAQADLDAVEQRVARQRKAAGADYYDAGPRPGEEELIGDIYLPQATAAAHRQFRSLPGTPAQDVGLIGRSRIKPQYHYESVLADYCIELLRHRDEPFAITYSVSPPHALWTAPAPYYDLYDPRQLPLPATWTDRPALWETSASARMGQIYGEAGLREYLRCYYAQVTMMDWCFGRILQALDDLKLADRTLVIFTSDHGNMLGQHGMMDKTHGGFYDDLMRVPLLVRLPGVIPAGKVCPAPVSSVDLAATILDYLHAPPLEKTHGRSLRAWIDGAAAGDRPVFGERGDPNGPNCARMIRTQRWKLCLYPRERMELFDLAADPQEIHDVADVPENAAVVRQLKQKLREHMTQVADPALKLLAPRL
jgi:arylsulfatase A-like enzyme